MKGAIGKAGTGTMKAVVDLLVQLVEKDVLDGVMIPIKVPDNDSFAYVLAQDISLLKKASLLPPVVPAQGAKALSRLTRFGKGNMRIAAVMRPCEIRATIELVKLGQIDLENVVLISMDCPGALPHSDFLADPEKGTGTFDNAVKTWDTGDVREICKMCEHSSMIAGDLHIGTLGAKEGTFHLIPKSQKGREVLDALGMSVEEPLEDRETKVKEIVAQRKKKRDQVFERLSSETKGLDGLLEAFSQCINCHNCVRVCPICYCQLCYFESDAVNHPSDDILQRATTSGSLRFPPDTLLFHIGRMLHMSLSCVSCGACEDACPMSIPVAQIFGRAARETQALFDYVPGRNKEEMVPLITYKEDELQEIGE